MLPRAKGPREQKPTEELQSIYSQRYSKAIFIRVEKSIILDLFRLILPWKIMANLHVNNQDLHVNNRGNSFAPQIWGSKQILGIWLAVWTNQNHWFFNSYKIVVYIPAGVIYCDSKVVFCFRGSKNLPKKCNKYAPKRIVKLFLYELRNQ